MYAFSSVLRPILLSVCLIALAACSLPRGGGIQREILRATDDATEDFALYRVTSALLPAVSQWPLPNEKGLQWITTSQGSRSQIIAAGDTVSLQIWDSNENSLLLGAGQRQVALPGMRVESDGTIFVPYIGDVRISGMSPSAARREIQAALEPIADTAQVQLSLDAGRWNSVDLVGGVTAPGSYPLPDRDYTVLSLISAGGGVSPALENPQIRLVRGSEIYGTSINRLFEEPRLDTLLRPGDQIIVEEDDRYFLSIGAAGAEAQYAFPQDVVSAMDAVSITGGVLDSRGNPQGILILREYPRAALAAGARGPREQRVVFALDLTSADGVFSARNFPIASRDVIYVTESPLNSLQTILNLASSGFGLILLADSISNVN
ncbi:MAG: polysaccharide biosynthesis/export family protein [Pseudomonadota bacterium]